MSCRAASCAIAESSSALSVSGDGFRKRTRPLAEIAQPDGRAGATGLAREKMPPRNFVAVQLSDTRMRKRPMGKSGTVSMLYAILCYNPEDVVSSWSKEQHATVMSDLAMVREKLTKERRLGPVARLLPTTAATTLRKGRENLVINGPFAETKE